MNRPPDLAEDEAREQRVAVIAPLLDVLRDLGVDPDRVLAEVGLPPGALDDPEGRISFAAFGNLLAHAAECTRCPHIGLLAGQRTGLQQMGVLGLLARAASTVGQALTALAVHQHLYSRGIVVFLHVEGARCTLGFPTYHPAIRGIEQLCDGSAVMVMNSVRELTTPDWAPDEVLLARAEPESLGPYRSAFPCRITFNAEVNALRFDRAVLDRPVPTADPPLYATLDRQIAAAGQRSLVNDLRRALRVELMRGDTKGERVAQMLDMHVRTLNRRLRATGTSFHHVLDEVRYTTARHYLELTEMPLVQIASALGYSEVSAFSRAFRRWSGTTPGEYRARRGTKRGEPGPEPSRNG